MITVLLDKWLTILLNFSWDEYPRADVDRDLAAAVVPCGEPLMPHHGLRTIETGVDCVPDNPQANVTA